MARAALCHDNVLLNTRYGGAVCACRTVPAAGLPLETEVRCAAAHLHNQIRRTWFIRTGDETMVEAPGLEPGTR